jgi:hypothetical protein
LVMPLWSNQFSPFAKRADGRPTEGRRFRRADTLSGIDRVLQALASCALQAPVGTDVMKSVLFAGLPR